MNKVRTAKAENIHGTKKMLFLVRDELKSEIRSAHGQFKNIDGRFESEGGQLDAIDARFEQVDARFKEIEGQFNQEVLWQASVRLQSPRSFESLTPRRESRRAAYTWCVQRSLDHRTQGSLSLVFEG